jgi:hypothetical protein
MAFPPPPLAEQNPKRQLTEQIFMKSKVVGKKGQRVMLNTDATGNVTPNIQTLKNLSTFTAGNAFTIQLPVGVAGKYNRKHSIKLFTQAVNYTGGVGLATKHLTGGGNDALTVTPAISASREPVTAAVVAGGAGYANGDTFSIVDATGAGAVFTVVTSAGGVVETVAYVANSAAASPCPPDFVIINPKIAIGNFTPYNVDTIFFAMRRQAIGLLSPLGELSIDFTDPARNFLRNNDITSWDTAGAGSMQITGTINALALKVQVTGIEIFDEMRNAYMNAAGATVVFANPFAYVQQPIQLVNGQVNITTLTPKGKISRLWIKAATPGSITQLQVIADGKIRVEGNVGDLNKKYREYGFRFAGDPSYQIANFGTSNALQAALNPFNFFDAAFIPDFDQREGDAIKISSFQNLVLTITATAAQTATVYMECLPGGFA